LLCTLAQFPPFDCLTSTYPYDVCRGENGELRVGFRRAMSQKANTSFVSSNQDLVHIGVPAKTWHAVNNRTMFTAVYKPRYVLNSCDRFYT
jgi:hypothetical protein